MANNEEMYFKNSFTTKHFLTTEFGEINKIGLVSFRIYFASPARDKSYPFSWSKFMRLCWRVATQKKDLIGQYVSKMDALFDCIYLKVNILWSTSPRRCCKSQGLGSMIAFYTEAFRILYFGWVGICLQREAGRRSKASSRLLLSHTWLCIFFVRTLMFSIVFIHIHLNWSSTPLFFFYIVFMFFSEFSRM